MLKIWELACQSGVKWSEEMICGMGCSILSSFLGFYNCLFGQDFVKSKTVIIKSFYNFTEFTTIIWDINTDIPGNTYRQLISTIDVKDSIGFVS